MKLWLSVCAMLVFVSTDLIQAQSQDASLDKLLSKLPPPEKLGKPPVQRAVERPDPAFKDPLGRERLGMVFMRNFPQALVLSRKVTERYPRSAASQCLRGALRSEERRVGKG